MKEQKKCVPEIRFAGFTDDWEQRKLLEIIEGIIDFRGKTPKKLGLEWSERGYLALSALNVKNGYIDKSIETYFGDEMLYQKWMGGSELTKGQVLFTTEAPMGNIAQVPDNEKYILSQRTIAFNVKPNIITDDFLAVLLRSPSVVNELEALSSGGTAKGVSQKSLSNLIIKLPNSLIEQTAIGNFFKQLDDTIALHQRTLKKYQKLKISYLEKMFPKENEQFPELRFPNFTDAWEQRKLGEVVNTFEYGLNVEAKAFDGINKYIRITDIDDESRTFLQKDLTSPNIDIQKVLEYKLVLGDILFARTGASVGKTYLFDKKDGSLYFAGFLIRANIKESFNANFIFQNTLTKNFDNFVSITSQRSGQPGINAKEYASFEFLCPSLAEQTTIGNFFKQLDDTIALHQREVEKYKKIKQAYLEKMFI